MAVFREYLPHGMPDRPLFSRTAVDMAEQSSFISHRSGRPRISGALCLADDLMLSRFRRDQLLPLSRLPSSQMRLRRPVQMLQASRAFDSVTTTPRTASYLIGTSEIGRFEAMIFRMLNNYNCGYRKCHGCTSSSPTCSRIMSCRR